MPETLLDYRRPETPRGLSGLRARIHWLAGHWAPVTIDAVASIAICLILGLAVVPTDRIELRITVMAGAWLPLAIAIYALVSGMAWVLGRLIENNYKTLLIGRYLRRRRIAWVSLIAVTLCTTMVLVVISVMGGWLNMFEENARGLSADLIIRSGSLAGFSGYEQIIDALNKDSDVAAAVPTLDTWGLLNIEDVKPETVHVLGFPIDQIGRVNKFPESLYLQHIGLEDRLAEIGKARRKLDRDNKLSAAQKAQELAALDKETASIDDRLRQPPTFNPHDPVAIPVEVPPEVIVADATKGLLDTGDAALNEKVHLEWGIDGRILVSRGPLSDDEANKLRSLSDTKGWAKAVTQLARESHWPGMIASTGAVEILTGPDGKLEGREPFKHHLPATLMVLGVSREGRVDPNNRADTSYWIMDDSHTGMWQYDMNTVYVPFDVLQSDLGMAPVQAVSKLTGKAYTEPARTHEIHVKLKGGADVEKVKARAQSIVDATMRDLRQQRQELGDYSSASEYRVVVQTWRESGEKYIKAIENEKVLVVVLFAIISIVAIFLIFCIFYMIVAEKTKDIGIIKSVGATNTGVAGIFLGYGLVIGLIGGGLALLCSYGVIHNINELHALMGRLMGIRIWNPEVYAFDKIPNTMDPRETVVIVSIAVLSSVLGALIPAIRAARMNPVEALRWE